MILLKRKDLNPKRKEEKIKKGSEYQMVPRKHLIIKSGKKGIEEMGDQKEWVKKGK